MRKLLALITILALALFMAGCATTTDSADDGYQFGDVSASLLDRQRNYCAEADPVRRAVLLAVIRSQVPAYPPSGLCTGVEQQLAEEIARRAGEAEGQVDFDQAVEDQRRYKEALDDARLHTPAAAD